MGLVIEIALRIFISVLNQFTKPDLNQFIEQFPKEVGEKIGQAVKGNLDPISAWLSESTTNVKLFISVLRKKKVKNELYLSDEKLKNIEYLIKAVLESINLIKKPIVLKEFFGNVNYYSLWQIEGYTNNAYSLNSHEITINNHFTILLIEANKVNYKKLLNWVSNSQPIPKRIKNKSLKVKTIRSNEVATYPRNFLSKWMRKEKTLPLNFSIDSYLNLLADIENNIEISTKPKKIWDKVKNFFKI